MSQEMMRTNHENASTCAICSYVEGGNSRLKEVITMAPTTVKKLGATEASQQDPLILLSERFNKDPHQSLYLISYTLSSSYSRAYLGKPNNPYIQLREKDKELVAARKFWGYCTPGMVKKEEAALKKLLERDGYAYEDAYVAEYSPSWVFYFLRHNEIVVPIKKASL
jgi:intergrase/recombinase